MRFISHSNVGLSSHDQGMATRDYLGRSEVRARTATPPVRLSPRSSSKPHRRQKAPRTAPFTLNHLFRKLRNRPRLYSVILSLLVGFLLAIWILQDTIVLARFKLLHHVYEHGWITRCGLRKRPLLFVQESDSLAIIVESNCDLDLQLNYGITLEDERYRRRWRREERVVGIWNAATVKKSVLHGNRFVYQALLDELEGGNRYAYEIVRTDPHSSPKVMARQSFPWLGKSNSSTIHLAAFADNQYNVRVFHRLLVTLISIFPLPSLLLHAGDQVQEPHNLQQWQTDFYEPLTSLLSYPLGQSTPMLLARGNHDWDETGVNIYTGSSPRLDWIRHSSLPPRTNHPGTFFAYSPHTRCRILVLDSNLKAAEDILEQENWLKWELAKSDWAEASLRIVAVHVPPFVEYWDKTAWTDGKENKWSVVTLFLPSRSDAVNRSSYVRERLTPLFSEAGATLVLSGHSHAYNRGYLPTTLHRSFTFSPDSSSLLLLSQAVASERSWEKTRAPLEGTVYVTFGGAGGSFDVERVEDWRFYEKTILQQHHFGWITMSFDRGEAKVEGKGTRIYRMSGAVECAEGERIAEDALEWTAVGIKGDTLDRFEMVTRTCISLE